MDCRRVLLLFPLLMLLTTTPVAASPESSTAALPGCPSKCGNVTIPYPFGIGPGCSREGFVVDCNDTQLGTQAPYLTKGNMMVMNVSLLSGELTVTTWMAYDCYNETDDVSQTTYTASSKLSATHLFSSTRNKFTAVGCATLAFITGLNDVTDGYKSGCVSFCADPDSVTEGSCSGMGCCQTAVPKGLNYFNVSFGAYNHSGVSGFSPCSYAFLVAEDQYNFSKADLTSQDFFRKMKFSIPTVLDWAIRTANSCQEAAGSQDYACRSSNSTCYDARNGRGYLCNCSQGYEGNPYLDHGCQDINECEHPESYPCHGRCVNLPGTYNCTCPRGTSGNATISECTPNLPLGAKVAIGISGGIAVLVVIGSLVFIKHKERTQLKEREKYFLQNGGQQLREEILKRNITFQIFTLKDLEEATKNFDGSMVLGKGGHGLVYKGILKDNTYAAIKRSSRAFSEREKGEFVNEIIILSQINHNNVVKLLGCCLEMDVPMLVYEFVSKGTLFQFLHDNEGESQIKLDSLLAIAAESAEALVYLHSRSPSIIHGDVKSDNILLDDNFVAKVADFGASQLVPMDDKEFVQFIQGTLGYLDPECQFTRRLTEKSDVYSFGVVLLELITRKEPIYIDHGDKRNLAHTFSSMMKEGKLREILDGQILNEGGMELLEEVSKLAMQCLNVEGKDRPKMEVVAERLQTLKKLKLQQPQGKVSIENAESVLVGLTRDATTVSSPNPTMEAEYLINTEPGR